MKDFLLLAYNNNSVQRVSENELEKEFERRRTNSLKHKLKSFAYENVIGYQIVKDKDVSDSSKTKHLIAGDIYGYFEEYNAKLLKYNEAIQLLDNSNLEDAYVAFEGNACFISVFDDKIVFQNDLEGYRKLFYYKDSDILCVSTHLPYILKVIRKDWKIRRNAVFSFLCSRESKWPLTFVENILSLPPLSRAEITTDEFILKSKTFSDYYTLAKVSKYDLREELTQQYDLIAQRKVGNNTAVTLSGGYDSNCLTKLYHKLYKNQITAISIGYVSKSERGENIYNETVYAEKAARHWGIPFRKYLISQEEFFLDINNFFETIDQPGFDPSSNYLMNRHLKNDGFDLVINGMGGDANFSNDKSLIFALVIHRLSKVLGIPIISFLGSFVNYRGPFRFFKAYPLLEHSVTFVDLFERSQLLSSPMCKYISVPKQVEIYEERHLRSEYYNKLFKSSLTLQEIRYSLALFANPDEFHALSMSERNGIDNLMPFVNTKAALMVMNGSKFNNVTNREFEMSLFGGIKTDLLAKKKSGFSIPYNEWIPTIADSVFDFYFDIKYFEGNDFNFRKFHSDYKTDESFYKSLDANKVLWKLFMVSEYMHRNKLSF